MWELASLAESDRKIALDRYRLNAGKSAIWPVEVEMGRSE
jgi:hypothetical protein